jgi:hypothetical protein
MTGRFLRRTPDDVETGMPAMSDVRRRAITSSASPRPTWTLLGTIAATKLAMLSAVLTASRAVDLDALTPAAGWSWLAAPAVLGGLAFAGLRLRSAPSAAGRSASIGGTDRSGREPPAGRRSETGSPSRPANRAWMEHVA